VEANKQIFYCFGCGKGGNVFQFIQLAEKLSYIEAVKFLADRAKITLPESDDPGEKERAELKKQILEINLIAARYFSEALRSRNGYSAYEYLKKRKISDNTVRKFGLGYSYGEWDDLYRYLRARKFSDDVLLKSGLVLKSSSGHYYDRFRDRVMFPIFDVMGNVIGFGGRVLDDSLPKYMNSPETLVYNKGRHLYALNFAKNSGSSSIIVVEGYMDVISLHQNGISNVVASLGTALTGNQGRILKKYADEIIIAYDADTAGQAATQRGLELLRDIGCNVRVLSVPDGKDPDEYIKKNGPDRFRKLAENALPLVEYKIKMLRGEHDLSITEEKIKFLNKAAAVMAKVDNVLEREMYIKKLSREYEISEEAMLSEVMRITRPAAKQGLRKTKAAVNPDKAVSPAVGIKEKIINNERFILSLLCIDNSIYNVVKEHFKIGQYMGEENNRIAEISYKRIEDRKGMTPAELLDIVSDEEAGDFARILNEECHCDDNQKAILGKIRDIKLMKAELRRNEVVEMLNNAESLPEGMAEKLKLELKALIYEISRMKNTPEFLKERRG